MTWYVYEHVANDGSSLYVGKCANMEKRELSHKYNSPWFCEKQQTIELSAHMTERLALVAELQAIKIKKPKYNVMNNGIKKRALTNKARDIGNIYDQLSNAKREAIDAIINQPKQRRTPVSCPFSGQLLLLAIIAYYGGDCHFDQATEIFKLAGFSMKCNPITGPRGVLKKHWGMIVVNSKEKTMSFSSSRARECACDQAIKYVAELLVAQTG